MITINQHVTVYEKNGAEIPPGEKLEIEINSHWNRQEFVVLDIGGTAYTVAVRDVEAALRNACNTARF